MGEGERINLGLNLQDLFIRCSAQFITCPYKKKTIFILFNRFPLICVCVSVCVGAKYTFTSPSPHFWPMTSFFLFPEALQSPSAESKL